MKDYFKIKTWLILLSMIFFSTLISVIIIFWQSETGIKVVEAGSEHNVYGWAWNDTGGWISFNSLNTGAATNYGVNVDRNTGIFSGYGWSETFGYIKFDPAGPYPVAPNNAVILNKTDGTISGWARICSFDDVPPLNDCSGGSHGWVKMSGTNYGVYMDSSNALRGYAWSDDIHWISFNCAEGGASGNNICSTANYLVYTAGSGIMGPGANVFGYGWSSNIGWVSFNCVNDNSCAVVNYGVNADPVTGNFSGYAWSPYIGWVSYRESSAPPDNYAFNANCPSLCNGTNACTACYNVSSQKVYGWAKIRALGDNGWLKMSDDSYPGWNGKGVAIDITTNDFHGWAWNGNSDPKVGIGWLSYNCIDVPTSCNGGTNSGQVCAGSGDCPGGSCDNTCNFSNYKVTSQFNQPPTATTLTAPNWSISEAQTLGALYAKLGWTFSDYDSGSFESAYQIIVRRTDNSLIYDSGKCLGSNSCEPVGTCDPNKCKVDNGDSGTTYFPLNASDGLNYGTPYFWWVMVWDNNKVPSILTQYNSPTDTDNDDHNTLTFTTYIHELPDAYFNWVPFNPSKGEEVKFYDASLVYLTGAPATPVNCTNSLCHWLWTKPADATFSDPVNDPASSTPIITFNSSGTVTLTVTDNDGFQTATSTFISIGQSLPTWTEEKPQ